MFFIFIRACREQPGSRESWLPSVLPAQLRGFFRCKTSLWEFSNPYFDWDDIPVSFTIANWLPFFLLWEAEVLWTWLDEIRNCAGC